MFASNSILFVQALLSILFLVAGGLIIGGNSRSRGFLPAGILVASLGGLFLVSAILVSWGKGSAEGYLATADKLKIGLPYDLVYCEESALVGGAVLVAYPSTERYRVYQAYELGEISCPSSFRFIAVKDQKGELMLVSHSDFARLSSKR